MSNNFDDSISDGSPPRPISRRSTLEYFNPAGAGGRFRRMFATREKTIEGLKTLFWVVPLTVLIWIYAERQQLLQSPAGVPNVPVYLRSNDSSKSVEYAGAGEPSVSLKLMGPQEGVRRAIDQLTQHIPHGLVIDLGSMSNSGDPQSFNVMDHIQYLDVFKNNGVTVQDAQPPELKVIVDKLGQREVSVQVPPENTTWTARFEPAKITVKGSEQLLKKLEQEGNLKAYAQLDGYKQLDGKTGTYPLVSVPIELSPPQPRLRLEPNQADANVVVAPSDVTYEIENVYVYILAQPITLATYSIQLESGGTSISHVLVKGPKEAIEQIATKSFIPRALLEFSEQDVLTKTSIVPKFDLPPGVEVVNEEARRPIKFTSTKL